MSSDFNKLVSTIKSFELAGKMHLSRKGAKSNTREIVRSTI